ncbi:YjzD family protein [Carnobacteriaceae bacterium zg-C25]|nr:YjzD family protein [Carnobacteriaceae bacterium zg-C25]
MKYIITFIWALIIAQVTFYLGAQLTQMSYNAMHAVYLAIGATVTVILATKILPPVQKAPQEEHH